LALSICLSLLHSEPNFSIQNPILVVPLKKICLIVLNKYQEYFFKYQSTIKNYIHKEKGKKGGEKMNQLVTLQPTE
jgi:hypothetical protein